MDAGELKGYGTFFDELFLLMKEAYGRFCPILKNVTCFDRWAKAHPTLLGSFGMQTSAGIKYGVPGINKSFPRG